MVYCGFMPIFLAPFHCIIYIGKRQVDYRKLFNLILDPDNQYLIHICIVYIPLSAVRLYISSVTGLKKIVYVEMISLSVTSSFLVLTTKKRCCQKL